MDKCFSGMITITFITCYLGFLSSIYLLISIFSHRERNIDSHTLHLTLLSIQCVLQVFCLVTAGQRINNAIRKFLHTLQQAHLEKNKLNDKKLKILQINLKHQE